MIKRVFLFELDSLKWKVILSYKTASIQTYNFEPKNKCSGFLR